MAVVAVPYLDPLVAPPLPPTTAPHERATARTSSPTSSTLGGSPSGAILGLPSLAITHAFVAGAAPSDSEKLLAIGGTELVEASFFDGFDYVALDHLHRPQLVGGDQKRACRLLRVAAPYSFREEDPKSV